MALLPSNLSFSRQVLPVLAVIGIAFAVVYIAFGLPDRSIAAPTKEPPKATGELADTARVAGSGIVEPASEVIDIGSALSGLVTDVRVAPGDRVEKGQPLFLVDARSARAQLSEA
ncbi:MAG: biotin/lipoyl-binding protein, partial [Pseudomonadota bacterium]